jgi:hypothetical protein
MNTEDDTFDALRNPPTEDEIAFGRKVWVYCDQHMRPHMTGWCTVGNRNKFKLNATTQEEAYSECQSKNYELYKG